MDQILRELALLFLAKDGPIEDDKGGASATLARRVCLLVWRADSSRFYKVLNKLEDNGWIERERDPRVHRTYRIGLTPDKKESDTIRDILRREDEILAKAREFPH